LYQLERRQEQIDCNLFGVKEPKHHVLTLTQTLTLTQSTLRKESYLATGSSLLQGKAKPRLRSSGGPPSSKDRDVPSSSSSQISTVPSRAGQLATSGPLDGGTLTYRRARSPARRPAAAPSPRSPSRGGKEETPGERREE
jgi:hypothetical protein